MAVHGSLTKTTGAATLGSTGTVVTGNVEQVAFEGIVPLTPLQLDITQVAVEGIKSYQTTPLRVTQAAFEGIVPRVPLAPQNIIFPGGGAPSVSVAPTWSTPAKYRIYVFDTASNLVAVFTNVRAFDFIDTVNGGSAAGWFRISVDTTTLLSENTTAGSRIANQYAKYYLQTLNAVTINISPTIGPPNDYKVTFSGNCGQQVVTIILDDYYRIAVPIYGNSNTPATFAAAVAAVVENYIDGIKNNPYSVNYTSGNAYLDIIGASAITYKPPGEPAVYIGVQAATSYTLPGALAAAYQQAFQYNYRVQFYLEDSINPWYDGRINGWTPQVPDTTTDDSYITVYTEGYQNALDDGIVSETLNPGLQPNGVNNGTITADQYLAHLINVYQNNKLFQKPYIASVNVDLFQLQFQGAGLASCINDVITQVINDTGHTFEWWVRGLKEVYPGHLSLAVVVQPNCDPNIGDTNLMRIAPTAQMIPKYYVYEVRGQTIFNYQVQNTLINLYNMIALYGGRDPTSQFQVYGAFEDSISIALYGVRQQRVTNSNLLTSETLNNYAIAYLLLNAYPQPQTTYYKYTPTDAMRAGVWVQVLEMGDGTIIAQNLHQMRSIQVECQLQEDQEKMDQIVTAAAPHPFIDHAYYGAIQQSQNTIPVVIDRGGTVNQNTYMVGGGDWVGTHSKLPPYALISIPFGHFGKADTNPDGSEHDPKQGPLDLSSGAPNLDIDPDDTYYPSINVVLADTNTGKHGDGAYELDFVTDLAEFAPGQSHGQGILVTSIMGPQSIGGTFGSGNVGEVPANPDLLRLWQFIVLNGSIAGAVDLRTYRGQYAGAPEQAGSILFTVPAGPYRHTNPNNVHYLFNAPPAKGPWYGGLQLGIAGSEVIMWFAQAGAPYYKLGNWQSYTPTIYNGDISWFGSISGTIVQIPEPDWAKNQSGWGPEDPGNAMHTFVRPMQINASTSTIGINSSWKKLPAKSAGPLGHIFYNPDFPGGQGMPLTIFVPQIQFPTVSLNYLYYEMTFVVNCANGNTLQTKRQLIIRNVNGGPGG